MYGYTDEARKKEELERFYRQQKSTQAKCNYGNKSCEDCKETKCSIREHIRN